MADLAASLAMPLDEWQEQALEAAMGERADGRWASKFVGVSAPRQNGKSQLIVARALAGVLLFGEKTIIISAHETDTAREIWKRMLNVIEGNPNLEQRVSARMDAINREFVAFGTGHDRQVIRLKARRKSGSRGFSADCLLLDEAQILDKDSWGSIVPTMSAMDNPQLWLFGTPPTASDQPFAWERVRSSAQAKRARHCWLEWAADSGDDIDDPETWAKANPAFGVRISYEACADDRAAMDDDQFRRERLGMWDERSAGEVGIPLDAWTPGALEVVPEAWPLAALGLDMHPATGRLYVSPAAFGPEPIVHVELVAEDILTEGMDAAVEWIVARVGRRLPVVIPADSPATMLHGALVKRRVKVYVLNLTEQWQASAAFERAVVADQNLSHYIDPLLDQAVKDSTRESHRSPGQWRFGRAGELSGAPLWATVAAHFGAVKWSKRRGTASSTESAREGRSSSGRESGTREAVRV